MASRWAYEGMMVSFFKDNSYNKPFFQTHFKKHFADDHFIYFIPELESRIQYALEYGNSNLFKHKDKIEGDLLVLKNEFQIENQLHKNIQFPNVDRLKPGCSLDVLEEASKYVAKLRTYYSDLSRNAAADENKLYKIQEEKYRGNQNMNLHRLNSHNLSIERFVKNKDEETKIIQAGCRLVQMIDPIFREPTEASRILSRAHFFSPYKYFFGVKMDTPVFNILMLWIMTGLLYITLYFDLLRKLINISSFKRRKGLSKA
jgi:hypothetical protein